MRRSAIEAQNRYLLGCQRQFRMAADVAAQAWMAFPEVQAIAVIGFVAKPLWREIPPFGDRSIETRGYTGPDGLHLPVKTYKAISLIFDLTKR